jgi:predicted DNA-binding protein
MAKVTTIRLDEEQLEQLEVIAGFEGRSVSDEIREAVDLLIAEKRQNTVFRDRVTLRLESLWGRQSHEPPVPR